MGLVLPLASRATAARRRTGGRKSTGLARHAHGIAAILVRARTACIALKLGCVDVTCATLGADTARATTAAGTDVTRSTAPSTRFTCGLARLILE